MAETAPEGSTPTFKLVLVGDGGTGKVRTHFAAAIAFIERAIDACGRDKQCSRTEALHPRPC